MPTFSFELYPPRTGPAELALYRSLDHLVAAGPEFISVTYGANGSTRGRTALGAIPERQIWINPDCGPKTRGYDETVASLENILAATRTARQKISV